jgi:hypothetical protein
VAEFSEFPPLNFRVTAFKDGVVVLADIKRVVRAQFSAKNRKALGISEFFGNF